LLVFATDLALASLHRAEKISQKTLGERVGIDRNHISRIEAPNGPTPPLELATLERLAMALGVKPIDLL
jgi:DNA-binding Xre family transcriptional regulator